MTSRVRPKRPFPDTAVHLTESAVDHVREFAVVEGKPDANLRVAVKGGGCSGLTYVLELVEDEATEDEKVAHVSRPHRLPQITVEQAVAGRQGAQIPQIVLPKRRALQRDDSNGRHCEQARKDPKPARGGRCGTNPVPKD